MSNPAQPIIDMKREKDFLICLDSVGCVFDTMEIRHKECFIPNTISEWGLQPVAKYAREVAEFVNLYSKWRSINRFPALIDIIDLLAEREEVKKRGFRMPDIEPLRKWVEKETKLGNPTLEAEVKRSGDPVLARALKWSKAVNESIAKIVRGVPPFPYVRESLIKMQGPADTVVISAAPAESLEREWKEHDIIKYVKVIAGQEMGSKTECLKLAKGNSYADEHVLMIGDALADFKAARDNNALFYPRHPGNEEESWQRFYEEAFDRFIK